MGNKTSVIKVDGPFSDALVCEEEFPYWVVFAEDDDENELWLESFTNRGDAIRFGAGMAKELRAEFIDESMEE